MASGGIDITPGRVLGNTELITPDKLNDIGLPVLRVQAGAITARELADGSINSDKLDVDLEAQLGVADGSVTTAKIVDGAVTIGKIELTAQPSVVQTVYAEYTGSTDNTNVIPDDDTIPQSTEGVQIISQAITPRSTTNKILAIFECQCSADGTRTVTAALFRDAVANALAGRIVFHPIADGALPLGFNFMDSPASLVPVTYKIRVGVNVGTFRLNGYQGATRVLGGAQRATLILQEIKA